jgi:transcriptional regulator with XRE-family HTH domain
MPQVHVAITCRVMDGDGRIGYLSIMETQSSPVGHLIREWRGRRRMSQLDLALEAEISQRHLSFVESGRATPSRDMVIRLAQQLDVPLRQQNRMLLAAGFAPTYPERPVDDISFKPAMEAIGLVLKAHEPNPALAVDGLWNLIQGNGAIAPFLQGVDAKLLEPPVNVLRLSLHPSGLAPRIANLAEWRAHLFERLRKQIEVSADPVLVALLDELRALPAPSRRPPPSPNPDYAGVVVPLQLATGAGVLSFLSTTTVFGTPVDVTLSEIALESFFPADQATAEALQRLSQQA